MSKGPTEIKTSKTTISTAKARQNQQPVTITGSNTKGTKARTTISTANAAKNQQSVTITGSSKPRFNSLNPFATKPLGASPNNTFPKGPISSSQSRDNTTKAGSVRITGSNPNLHTATAAGSRMGQPSPNNPISPIQSGGGPNITGFNGQPTFARTPVHSTQGQNNPVLSTRPRTAISMISNDPALANNTTKPMVDVDNEDHYFAQRVRQAQAIVRRQHATSEEQQKAEQNLADCRVACALYDSERANIRNREDRHDADPEYNALCIRASKALMQRLVDDWDRTTKKAEAGYMQRLNQLGFIEMVMKKEEARSIRSAGMADNPGNDGIASIGSVDVPDADNSSSQVVAASVGRDEVFLAVKSFAPALQAPENTTAAQAVTVKLMGEKGKIANISDPRAFNTLSEADKNKAALQQARMYLMKYYKPNTPIVIRGSDDEHKARIEAALRHCLSICSQDIAQTQIVCGVNRSNVQNNFDSWFASDRASLQEDESSLSAVVNQRNIKETLRGTIMENNAQFVKAHEPPEPLAEQRDDLSHPHSPGGGGS